jgi:glycosyltransferase involved in cell wall biosynthesis
MATPVLIAAGKHPLRVTGGHSSYVRTHARAAERAGYEPHIFCVGRERGEETTDFGVIHTARSALSCKHAWTTPLHSPVVADDMVRFALGHSAPHLLHGIGMWAHATARAARRLRSLGRPAVSVAGSYVLVNDETGSKLRATRRHHGLRGALYFAFEHGWSRVVMRGYERRMLAGSDIVLTNYRSVSDGLARAYPIAERLRMVPYTAESAFLNGHAADAPGGAPADATDGLDALIPADAPLIVSVSRHDPRKGLDVLLAALARLRDRDVSFRACLVGPGRVLEAHRKLAARLDLSDRVAIPGGVPDPMPYLRRADVFVLPSLQEGSGSVSLIEATQAGVPIVASDLDGIPEDVEHDTSALLVPPGDPDALAAALRRLVTQPELRDRLARASREVFETRFSAETMTAGLAAAYAELGFLP